MDVVVDGLVPIAVAGVGGLAAIVAVSAIIALTRHGIVALLKMFYVLQAKWDRR